MGMRAQMHTVAARNSGKMLHRVKEGDLDAYLAQLQGWQQVAACWAIELALQKERNWTLTGSSLAETIVVEHFHKVERWGAETFPLTDRQRAIVAQFYTEQVQRADGFPTLH